MGAKRVTVMAAPTSVLPIITRASSPTPITAFSQSLRRRRTPAISSPDLAFIIERYPRQKVFPQTKKGKNVWHAKENKQLALGLEPLSRRGSCGGQIIDADACPCYHLGENANNPRIRCAPTRTEYCTPYYSESRPSRATRDSSVMISIYVQSETRMFDRDS
jgi:hypothetical protein